MKDYLLDVMQQHEHGLYMCELPTGNGKTYDSARAMKEYADSIGDDTKNIVRHPIYHGDCCDFCRHLHRHDPAVL